MNFLEEEENIYKRSNKKKSIRKKVESLEKRL